MKRGFVCLSALALLGAHFMGCGGSGSSDPGGTSAGAGGAAGSSGAGGGSGADADGASGGSGGASGRGGVGGNAGVGGAGGSGNSGGAAGMGGVAGVGGSGGSGAAGGSGGAGGSAGDAGAPTADEVKAWVEAYKAAHPGNGGKDWDINAKTPAEIAADPALQQLMSVCGKDERPVFPLLAWEYGGGDHSWINPDASALVYCVYIPVNPSSPHWQYDATQDHVTADVYVRFPDQNPCKDQQGADQVLSCLGDPTNIEILVDTASLNDGTDAGLALANASTDLNLILADGNTVHLYTGM